MPPWDHVKIDVIGPHKETSSGLKYILIGICPSSMWVEAEPIKDKTAECVYLGLRKWIFRWGFPSIIWSSMEEELTKVGNKF